MTSFSSDVASLQASFSALKNNVALLVSQLKANASQPPDPAILAQLDQLTKDEAAEVASEGTIAPPAATPPAATPPAATPPADVPPPPANPSGTPAAPTS